MKDVHSSIQSVFSGLDFSETEIQGFYGMYILASYKNILELITFIKVSDKDYLKKLIKFFDEEISSLPQDKKNACEQSIMKANAKLLVDMFSEFSKKMPEDKRKILFENMTRLNLK